MPQSRDASSAFSRRDLLAGASAFVVPRRSERPGEDPALAIARQWCALETEQRRLILRWQDLETWLFAHRDWPKLSDAERAAVSEVAGLDAIDAQLAAIDRTYDALLPQLKRTAATTRAGVLARFEALLWFLDSTDHPHARALLKSCQRDLKRLWV